MPTKWASEMARSKLSEWDQKRLEEKLRRDPALREAHRRAEERQRELRRSRLYFFRLAGGRRSK